LSPVLPAFGCILRAIEGQLLFSEKAPKEGENPIPKTSREGVPAMGIEPILPRKRDFESR
jgi:hypothetical protein